MVLYDCLQLECHLMSHSTRDRARHFPSTTSYLVQLIRLDGAIPNNLGLPTGSLARPLILLLAAMESRQDETQRNGLRPRLIRLRTRRSRRRHTFLDLPIT